MILQFIEQFSHRLSLSKSLPREKFGRVDEIRKMGKGVGEVAAVRHDGSRFVYNLVTKPKYSDKPTYESLRKSLEDMRGHARDNSVKEIAMPKVC